MEVKSKIPLQEMALILSVPVTPTNVHKAPLWISPGHREKSFTHLWLSLHSYPRPFPIFYFPMYPYMKRLKGFKSLNITAKRTFSFEGSFFLS